MCTIGPIGLDIGKVLGPTVSERWDPVGQRYNLVDPYPGAIEFVLANIEAAGGPDKVGLLSCVREPVHIGVNQQLLEYWCFYERTGIPRSNVDIYCGKPDEKVAYVKERKYTLFYDDHPSTLVHMPPNVEVVAISPDPEEWAEYRAIFEGRRNSHCFPRDYALIARELGLRFHFSAAI